MESAGTEPKASVQARAVGITTSGMDRVLADKAQTHCPRLEELDPRFLRNRNCLILIFRTNAVHFPLEGRFSGLTNGTRGSHPLYLND